MQIDLDAKNYSIRDMIAGMRMAAPHMKTATLIVLCIKCGRKMTGIVTWPEQTREETP